MGMALRKGAPLRAGEDLFLRSLHWLHILLVHLGLVIRGLPARTDVTSFIYIHNFLILQLLHLIVLVGSEVYLLLHGLHLLLIPGLLLEPIVKLLLLFPPLILIRCYFCLFSATFSVIFHQVFGGSIAHCKEESRIISIKDNLPLTLVLDLNILDISGSISTIISFFNCTFLFLASMPALTQDAKGCPTSVYMILAI